MSFKIDSNNTLPTKLPDNIIPKKDLFESCTILNANWYPATFGNITLSANKQEINVRVKDNVSNAILRVTFSLPTDVFYGF